MTGRRLTLYYRHGCSLCDDMLHGVEALQQELGFSLDIMDVDAEPAGRLEHPDLGRLTAGLARALRRELGGRARRSRPPQETEHGIRPGRVALRPPSGAVHHRRVRPATPTSPPCTTWPAHPTLRAPPANLRVVMPAA